MTASRKSTEGVTGSLPQQQPHDSSSSERKDARRNREAIVTAALQTLDENPTASIDEIATRAGISRRAIYRHFGSRNVLLRGVAQILIRRAGAALEDLDRSGAAPDVRLVTGAAMLWDSLGDRKRLVSYRLNGAVRAFAFEQAAPLRTYLLGLIEEGRDAGLVRTDLTAEGLQYLIETHAAALLEAASESPLPPSATREVFLLSMLADIGHSSTGAQAFLSQHGAELSLGR